MGLVLSPRDLYGGYAVVRFVASVGGGGEGSFEDVAISRGVRPVLSLKSGSLTKGLGTATDPYTV